MQERSVFGAICIVGIIVVIVSVQLLLTADRVPMSAEHETSVQVLSDNSTAVRHSVGNLAAHVSITHDEINVTHIIATLSAEYSPTSTADVLSFSVAVYFYAQDSNYAFNETVTVELLSTNLTKTWNGTNSEYRPFAGISFDPFMNGTYSLPASVQETYSLRLTWDVRMIMRSQPDAGFNCTLGLAVRHMGYVYVAEHQQMRTWTVALGGAWLLIVFVAIREMRRVIVVDDTQLHPDTTSKA